MIKDLYSEFTGRLEQIFGRYNERRKKFKKASNSKIARELCYSDSQFSRLINESASEGEYQRAIRNVDRLLKEKRMQEEVVQTEEKGTVPLFFRFLNQKTSVVIFSGVTLLILSLLFFGSLRNGGNQAPAQADRDGMLHWIFENASVSPYLQLNDMPEDCSYSCYKYQGQWSLKNTYKIPFFRERNGFHYLAKDVNLYTRCNTEETENGNILEGYEYQEHEIWYDKRELKIDSFLVDTNKSMVTNSYKNLQFEDDTNFVKVARVHTFFRNEFHIDTASVKRSGMVVGRDVEFIDDNQLLVGLGSPEMLEEIKREINAIIINRLEDFSRPISCQNAALPNTNFHEITESDSLRFNCQLTTANAPITYIKTYVLDDQYIETTCRP